MWCENNFLKIHTRLEESLDKMYFQRLRVVCLGKMGLMPTLVTSSCLFLLSKYTSAFFSLGFLSYKIRTKMISTLLECM